MFNVFCNRGKDALGEEVIKPYTPTTLDSDVGYFELVIKVRHAKSYHQLFLRKLPSSGFQYFVTNF